MSQLLLVDPPRQHAKSRAALSPAAARASKRYLRHLRRELNALGVMSEVITSGTWPRLRLGSPYTGGDPTGDFEGHLLAADAGAGWSYWWPWVQRIGPVTDPAKAAGIIADELGVEIAAHDKRAS